MSNMEKRGYIDPEWTPEVDNEKSASNKDNKKELIKKLDNDLTKQFSDRISGYTKSEE